MSKIALASLCFLSGAVLLRADVDRVPAGTRITVRTNERIDARGPENGRFYTAVVDRNVLGRDGQVAIPRGSPAQLVVREIPNHELLLDLDSVVVHGHRYEVDSSKRAVAPRGDEREGVGANDRTAKFLGGGAIVGSIIGAIAGGGKGAAIGAATGAGAGAAAQTVTRGDRVRLPAESLVTFRLNEPLRIHDRNGDRNDYRNSRYDRDRHDGDGHYDGR